MQNLARLDIFKEWQGGSSSVVECFLAKEDVAGSTPVSRSNKPICGNLHTQLNVTAVASTSRGAVPKW